MAISKSDKNSYAICLIGHGSRNQEATQEFQTLLHKIRDKRICPNTQGGFLEFAKPTVTEALSACLNTGLKNIIILPGILFSGKHTETDIPNSAFEILQNYPETNLIFSNPLETHPEVMQACKSRIQEAEITSTKSIPRSETLLITIGHGSKNTNCNLKVKNEISNLGEKLGFAKTLIFFSGINNNSLDDLQESFIPHGFNRVIIFPFFLFSGVWVKRVHTLADEFQLKYQDTEFLKASCLSHHDKIVEALVQRAKEKAL
ncbi:MAG: sirohydrochlorin chelatase [Nitrospinae bacterium]|nr:sirohydrochlorin chelatase [Nitrospinota bacterium]